VPGSLDLLLLDPVLDGLGINQLLELLLLLQMLLVAFSGLALGFLITVNAVLSVAMASLLQAYLAFTVELPFHIQEDARHRSLSKFLLGPDLPRDVLHRILIFVPEYGFPTRRLLPAQTPRSWVELTLLDALARLLSCLRRSLWIPAELQLRLPLISSLWLGHAPAEDAVAQGLPQATLCLPLVLPLAAEPPNAEAGLRFVLLVGLLKHFALQVLDLTAQVLPEDGHRTLMHASVYLPTVTLYCSIVRLLWHSLVPRAVWQLRRLARWLHLWQERLNTRPV